MNSKVDDLNKPMDNVVFGDGVFVYCSAHCRPHLTGWCTVPSKDKTPLKAKTHEEAYEECRKMGVFLYDDWVAAGMPHR